MRIVKPVVLAPLRDEWEIVRQDIAKLMADYQELMAKARARAEVRVDWSLPKEQIAALMAEHRKTNITGAANKILADAKDRCNAFLHRLESIRILDPACGSGNFLYLSLLGLKDLEHQVITEAEALGLPKVFPSIGPRSVMGIEVNVYAAELARVTIWIGQIQWMLRHGWGLSRDPILKPLDQISCRDAIVGPDGTEAEWPAADCIVGNPPFLGDKKILAEMGEPYANQLRNIYKDRVPGSADLVNYWFEKARAQIAAGKSLRAGLVSTNSIRGGKSNRLVLDRIFDSCVIFEAYSNEPWVVEGAAVRVSIICFARRDGAPKEIVLDGQPVAEIYSDLTSRPLGTAVGTNLTKVLRLQANHAITFQGIKQVGRFTVPGALAREWLQLPVNPNGRPNSDVLRPWVNGKDITKRPSDTWIVDFGVNVPMAEAALYEKPFEYVATGEKKKKKGQVSDSERRENWWLFERTRAEMRTALRPLRRFIVTPRVAKYCLFVWIAHPVIPDTAVVVIAREDETTFGILQSRFHDLWALRKGTWLGVGDDPRYTPSTTFETFPFPEGLTPDTDPNHYIGDPRAVLIAEAARKLNHFGQPG
ncbi:MAG TPA: DNA methyltransferase [Bryobacteraceae bacterium]|nr:DNA methyltransferase [Bryobacteraceae bacterium]